MFMNMLIFLVELEEAKNAVFFLYILYIIILWTFIVLFAIFVNFIYSLGVNGVEMKGVEMFFGFFYCLRMGFSYSGFCGVYTSNDGMLVHHNWHFSFFIDETVHGRIPKPCFPIRWSLSGIFWCWFSNFKERRTVS